MSIDNVEKSSQALENPSSSIAVQPEKTSDNKPALDRSVIDAFLKRMQMLDSKRNGKLKNVELFSGKIEVLTKIQAMISEKMKGMKDKDDKRDIPYYIHFTTEEIKRSPGLKAYLETVPNADRKKISFLIGSLVDGLSDRSFNRYQQLNLDDFRRLSESLSNQVKVFNDRTNELTTKYQDFSNKYDATVDAISKFLDKFFQALAKIQNNTL